MYAGPRCNLLPGPVIILLPLHYARCCELSNIYGKELVVFDLEHTGGPKGARGITEFGAVVLGPGGIQQEYLSLVRPDDSAIVNAPPLHAAH